jgi:hypothetical protein
MVAQIRAAHYMIFSISAFALFILMSYYASTNTVTQQMHSHAVKSIHHFHPLQQQLLRIEKLQEQQRLNAEANHTKIELNGANLGELTF